MVDKTNKVYDNLVDNYLIHSGRKGQKKGVHQFGKWQSQAVYAQGRPNPDAKVRGQKESTTPGRMTDGLYKSHEGKRMMGERTPKEKRLTFSQKRNLKKLYGKKEKYSEMEKAELDRLLKQKYAVYMTGEQLLGKYLGRDVTGYVAGTFIGVSLGAPVAGLMTGIVADRAHNYQRSREALKFLNESNASVADKENLRKLIY